MRKIRTTRDFDKKFIKLSKNKMLAEKIITKIKMLAQDINTPELKTHKLSGNLKNFYACSVNFEYRIVFSFDDSFVFLDSIGTHDEVY